MGNTGDCPYRPCFTTTGFPPACSRRESSIYIWFWCLWTHVFAGGHIHVTTRPQDLFTLSRSFYHSQRAFPMRRG